ncbi:hypothetical protein QR680_003293 [Steinernema hermaphroditum]|uniref:Nuclear receptor domain-containing protein n=1 Tax=Steinernema hermaphroditum TaxID=289476 RepID=A0AA39H645_9BILA|nr:hypothetical protein QR680_003293 [Steinernema hermaphroditum]
MDYNDYWAHQRPEEDELEEIEEINNQMEGTHVQMIPHMQAHPAQQPPTYRYMKVRMPVLRDVMMGGQSSVPYQIREKPTASNSANGESTCAVCGDGQAKLHYGVLACYGCKGFFRRTLIGKYRYVCRFGNNCIVDKYQRNSCRFCRFNRCLEAGMDPKAVRPDRDLTGKQKVPRIRKKPLDDDLLNHMMRLQGDEWARKLPVEARILFMQLMNIENKVSKGDNGIQMNQPSARTNVNVSLRELFEQKPNLDGRRTEMCYEPYRMAKAEEISSIAHRGAIAAVDWVDSLSEIGDIMDTEDKVSLVKSSYAPLTIFNFSARTAQKTKNPDILCLCSYSYVPRKLPPEFNASIHLSNTLIDRTLNELVAPLRKLNLREEELVPLKAIIILNPNSKGISPSAQQQVSDLRDKVQDMLFQIVKELHPGHNASSRFGNLLLLLPTISTLSGLMAENMQFNQVFGSRHSSDPLLHEMFGDVKLEEPMISSTVSSPLFENPAEISLQSISPPTFTRVATKNAVEKVDNSTQTEMYDDCISPPTSLCSNSLMQGNYSPPNQFTQNSLSPFNLLDDDWEKVENPLPYSPTPPFMDSNLGLDTGDMFDMRLGGLME